MGNVHSVDQDGSDWSRSVCQNASERRDLEDQPKGPIGALSRNLCPKGSSDGFHSIRDITYIQRQFPDFARLPPMTGPSESAIIKTALMRLRYELLCLS